MIEKLSPVPGLDIFSYDIREGEYDRENAFIHSRDINLTLAELETMLDAVDAITPYGWRYLLPWFVEAIEHAPTLGHFGYNALKFYAVCDWTSDRAYTDIARAVQLVADEIRKQVAESLRRYFQRCEDAFRISVEYEDLGIDVESTLDLWDPK